MRSSLSIWSIVAVALWFAQGISIRADVVINEVQTSNGSTLMDEDGDYSDWVELLNCGPGAVNLAGWGLSDRASNPMKWVFPSCPLEAGERRIVFASSKDRTNVLETVLLDSPRDIPGLVLWLNAEDEVFAPNAKMPVWADRSGYGNHATQTVVNAQPVFVANAVNGLPAVRFTRSAQQQFFLPVSAFNGLPSLRDVSIFIVCRWNGAATSGLFGMWGSNANSHFEISDGNGELRLRIAALDNFRSANTVTRGAWGQVAGVMNSAGDAPFASMYYDGLLRNSLVKDPGPVALASHTTMAIGNSDSNTRFFDGDMAEVLIFNRALSAAEREAVGRYLANRYRLPFQGGAAVPELHTSFGLSAGGETVVLAMPGGTVADSLDVPALPTDASYGRSPDATGAPAFFDVPTPNAVNTSTAYDAPTALPVFSHERGIYDTPFSLTLAHGDPLASMYYTLDGSEPAPTNGAPYSAPIAITNTAVVRAAAFKAGALPRRAIATHTYLFLDSVVAQTNRPAGYPADWNGFANTSYAISPTVAAQPGHADALRAALRAVPVLSLSASVADMFGTDGVYANPTVDGFERRVSVEWITNGVGQGQTDAGLRVQGGASRQFGNTPKKSFRLLFKDIYGQGRLKTPVLASGGTALADFNTLILRAEYNNAWTHSDITGAQRLRGTNLRDQWMRDTQIAMSGTGSHGNHAHLFINGLYWGLYNVSERPDAAFASNYFGDEREDYDAMTHDGIRDGDNVAWNAMRKIAQADLDSQANYEAIKRYLNLEHFADYMIVNLYGGNEDWPFNNWNAVRRRAPDAGYLFYCWDAERTLESPTVNRTTVTGSNNPAEFYAALQQSEEFRLLFADRLQRHFFNGGALTPENAANRYAARAAVVGAAVYGEAARWGAYRNGGSPYGMTHWSNEYARLMGEYFPVRTGIVLEQFRTIGLYPNVAAPVFSQHGGVVAGDLPLSVTAPQGTIYLTLDGSDPRMAHLGIESPGASVYTAPLTISGACVVKARALHNGEWSALAEAAFTPPYLEHTFLPPTNGDWWNASNWSGNTVPYGTNNSARFTAPAAERSVSIRAPLSIGRIVFDHGSNAFRDRIRDQDTGNTLTLNGGAGAAYVRITGTGTGYAEFEVAAGVFLQTDLTLDVQNIAGHVEYGAARIRAGWYGSGGLRKTGPGMTAFTGEDKSFTGAVTVDEGVLSITGPAAPTLAASVAVSDGGQLRLTSGGTAASPRVYTLNGPLTLEGYGRGAGIPDSSSQGKLGALRYDPGNQDNVCILDAAVSLRGEVNLHVDGARNHLRLAGPLAGDASRLVKTGGGTLTLPGGTALTTTVEIANGTLAVAGPFAAGAFCGSGTLRVDGHTIDASEAGGIVIESMLRIPGAGSASANGVLKAAALSAPFGALRLYLPTAGDRFQGGVFAPYPTDLAAALRATPKEVYRPDPSGSHTFDGSTWSLATNAQVVAVPHIIGGVIGRVVEVRLDAAPASYHAWRQAVFTNGQEYADSDISGPLAEPFGDRVANLQRYAFGMDRETPAAERFPRLTVGAAGADYRFAFDPSLNDLAYVVEATNDLREWSGADLLFDSRIDYPISLDAGWLTLRDTTSASQRFYRLRLIWLDN